MSTIKHRIIFGTQKPSDETVSVRNKYLLHYLQTLYDIKVIGLNSIRTKKFFVWYDKFRQLHNFRKLFLKTLKKFDPDLMHLTSPFQVGKIGYEIANAFEIPFIYEVQQLEGFGDTGNASPQKIKKIREQETTIMYYAEQVITSSAKIRQQILSRGIEGEKILVIPDGIDSLQVPPLVTQAKNPILIQKYQLQNKKVIGFLNIPSNADEKSVFIQLLIKLIVRIPDLKFILPGNNYNIQMLMSSVQPMNLSTHLIPISVDESVSRHDLFSLMDLVILLERDDFSISEDTMLEIMLMGKNILAAENSRVTEFIQNGVTGFYFQPENLENLVTKCATLLERDILRQKIGQAARNWVQQNRDWNTILEQYHVVYERILTK